MQNHTWAVVLAAGDGKRLSELTADNQGKHVPKQFCSVNGGTSLFGLALERARSIVPDERVCTVVAKDHERWWKAKPHEVQRGNLIVQPRNRGTGNGVLLAVAHILKRDPQARLIFLPADHHVLAEEKLIETMSAALAEMPARTREIFLLGIEPDDADPELGYIIPQKTANGDAQGVRHFVEKPSRAVASKLIEDGGLWNSAIFAVDGERLLEVFKERCLENALGIKGALEKMSDPGSPSWTLSHLYERISDMDFSRHILQFYVSELRVVRVPHCGWSDLGTPHRVTERVNQLMSSRRPDLPGVAAFLDLADAVARAGKREALAEAAA